MSLTTPDAADLAHPPRSSILPTLSTKSNRDYSKIINIVINLMVLPPAPPPTLSTLSNCNSPHSTLSSQFMTLPTVPQPALHHRPSLWEVFPAGRPTTAITPLVVSTRPSNRFIEDGAQEEDGNESLVRAGSDEAVAEEAKNQSGWGASISRSLKSLWTRPLPQGTSFNRTDESKLLPGYIGKEPTRGVSSSTTSTSPYPTRSTRHAPLLPPPPVHRVRFAPSHRKSISNSNESVISRPPLVQLRKPTPYAHEFRQQVQITSQTPQQDPYERKNMWKNSWKLASLPRLGKEYWQYRILGGTPTYLSPEGSSSADGNPSPHTARDGPCDGAGDIPPLLFNTDRPEGRGTTTTPRGGLTKTKMTISQALKGAGRVGKKVGVAVVNVLTLILVLPILVPYEVVYGCYRVVQHKRSAHNQPRGQHTGTDERRSGEGGRWRWKTRRGWWKSFGEWVQGVFRSDAGDAVLGWLYFWAGTVVVGGCLGLRWCWNGRNM